MNEVVWRGRRRRKVVEGEEKEAMNVEKRRDGSRWGREERREGGTRERCDMSAGAMGILLVRMQKQ
jgi:hypothetical protein